MSHTKKTKKGARNSRGVGTVQELLDKAEEHIVCGKYVVALRCCQQAMDLDADNSAAIEMAAEVFLDTGELEKAKTHLERAVLLNPDKGHYKYVSLAQLCEGKEAVEYYRKGIEVLNIELVASQEKDTDKETVLRQRRELSNAYCALVELFSTDLCDEPNADEQCVKNINEAIAMDPNNPEAYLCNASYLVDKDKQEAKKMLKKSLSFWLPQMQANEEGPFVELCDLPPDSRVTTVKLLIEVEDFETGADVLDALINDDAENVELWYLSGLLNYLRGEDFQIDARHDLKKAQRMILYCGEENAEMNTDIESMLSELGPGNPEDNVSSDEDKENMNEDDEDDASWLDDSDEEESMDT